MNTTNIVIWEEDGAWLGYLQEYPDYWTQGETPDDLKEHLRDLHQDLAGGDEARVEKLALACKYPDLIRTIKA